jgi:hypothetical protein
MNRIRIFISKLLPKKTTISTSSTKLGRWNIDYCNVKIYRKIDMSNEDHCGPCGQYKFKIIKQK